MMIAERPAAGQGPPGLFEIAEEALRLCNAGKCERRTIRTRATQPARERKERSATFVDLSVGDCVRPPRRKTRPLPTRRRAAHESGRMAACAYPPRRLAARAGRCHAPDRNAESHRRARERCIPAGSRRCVLPHTGSPRRARRRLARRAPAFAARRRNARLPRARFGRHSR